MAALDTLLKDPDLAPEGLRKIDFAASRMPVLAAVARWGAWINLFNLLPVWQLDGGRAFHALSRPQRILAAAALGAAWFFTREGLLVILALTAAFRAFGRGG